MSRGLALLGVALLGASSISCGDGGHTDQPDAIDERGWAPDQPGIFGFRRPASRPSAIGEIGYASGTEEVHERTGVLRHDRDRAFDGLNLMCSGDAAAAELVAMDGEVVHRWELPYSKLPDAPPLEGAHQLPWRRVHLLEDGGLLAIHSGRALVCVDRDSNLRWVTFDRAHHDIAVADDGTIFALTRTERIVPEVNPGAPIIDDIVRSYAPDGTPLGSFSLWDAFTRSSWADMLGQLTVREGDVMHANAIEWIDRPAAARLALPDVGAGQLMICMRDLDLVVTVEVDRGVLTWITMGPQRPRWRAPHDPTVSADGSLLIFDNRGGPGETSRVLRVDPASGRIDWSWGGDPPATFASFFCGTAQELPNGNVLATESSQGRAIEIDPRAGDIVWEYVSDRVAGPDDEFVAALFAVERVLRPDWL